MEFHGFGSTRHQFHSTSATGAGVVRSDIGIHWTAVHHVPGRVVGNSHAVIGWSGDAVSHRGDQHQRPAVHSSLYDHSRTVSKHRLLSCPPVRRLFLAGLVAVTLGGIVRAHGSNASISWNREISRIV